MSTTASENRTGYRNLAAWIATATGLLLVVVEADLAPWIRGEGSEVWTWPRRANPSWTAATVSLAIASILVGVVASGIPERVARRGARARSAMLGGIVVLGSCFWVSLLAQGTENVLQKLIVRTVDPAFTSHHAVAVAGMPDGARTFVDRHRELLPDLPAHASTHPPGPALYYRAWIAAFEHLPEISRTVSRRLGYGGEEQLDQWRPPQSPASISAALFGALGLLLAGATTAWPVERLTALLTGDPAKSLRAAALWPLVPGGALMAPQADQALALPVAGCAAACLGALLARRPTTFALLSALAGACAGGAVFVSYGAFTFVAGCGAAAAAMAWGLNEGQPVRFVCGAAIATAIGGGIFLSTRLLGHEPIAALIEALSIHGHRLTWNRPWAISVALNAADALLFVGPPILLLLGQRVATVERRNATRSFIRFDRTDRWSVALVAAFLLSLLSGVVRGEAGRIFVPWMPLLLVAAVAPGGSSSRGGRDLLFSVLGAVLAFWTVSLAMTLRIS